LKSGLVWDKGLLQLVNCLRRALETIDWNTHLLFKLRRKRVLNFDRQPDQSRGAGRATPLDANKLPSGSLKLVKLYKDYEGSQTTAANANGVFTLSQNIFIYIYIYTHTYIYIYIYIYACVHPSRQMEVECVP